MGLLAVLLPAVSVSRKAASGAALSSLIQRRSTPTDKARWHAAYDTATPLSVTSFTTSVLNSRLNFRLVISNLQSRDHDLIVVSTKPAAVKSDLAMLQAWFFNLNVQNVAYGVLCAEGRRGRGSAGGCGAEGSQASEPFRMKCYYIN